MQIAMLFLDAGLSRAFQQGASQEGSGWLPASHTCTPGLTHTRELSAKINREKILLYFWKNCD